jgi:signal transduction histidine kinase
MLGLGRTGHLLAAFLPSAKKDKAMMGIVVLSPYSDRRWSREDQEYLNSIVTKLASFLQQGIDITKLEKSLTIAEQNLKSFQNLLEASQAENAGLRDELRRISQKGYEEKDLDLANLQSKHTDALDKIEQLQIENIKLQELLANIQSTELQSREDDVDYQEELQLTLQEMARLQKQLSDSDVQLLELQKEFIAPETMSDEQIEVFTSIVQELRQPMSSIVGYTDLLLGESVGILGALQRKFLDRIKVSTERMDILITDLFQVVTMDSGELEIRPESVDLGIVIDNAIADAKTQFQQRGIVLRVDLPTEMPQLQADRDALQQILIQLLKNAGTASPENGEIFFRTSLYQTEDHQDFVLMQVADQGGGIPKEDLPRVFSRLYRANNPLIQGVGDTGVGLSIVKTLVDAHHGRIWVDTEMGKGSTFSLLLPLSTNDSPLNTLEEELSL